MANAATLAQGARIANAATARTPKIPRYVICLCKAHKASGYKLDRILSDHLLLYIRVLLQILLHQLSRGHKKTGRPKYAFFHKLYTRNG